MSETSSFSDGDSVPPGFIIEDQEIIADFIVEAKEFLEQMDQDLIQLEQTPEDLELLNSIFRAIHTIKGNAAFLGFEKLMRFSHQLENVLDKLRSGQMAATADIMDLILEGVDLIKSLLANLHDDSHISLDALLERLTEVLKATEAPRSESLPPIDTPLSTAEGDEMDEIIDDFMIESAELLEQLDRDLLLLEQHPEDLELLNNIFRPVHTIKGNASFLGFNRLTRFTHQLENVLDKLRSGDMAVTESVMDLVLDGVDKIKSFFQNLRQEEQIEIDGLIQRLEHCLGGLPSDALLSGATNLPGSGGVGPADLASHPLPPTASQGLSRKKEPEEQTIRVDVERLDALMNLAGELVIAKNRLQQFYQRFEEEQADSELLESLMLTNSLISYITGQFQEAVMKTRMLPIRKVFSRVPRMVRDLARDTKKRVALTLSGEDTELDKSVIEHIGDPLVHVIRNAIDHGLEYPQEREQKGKNPEGQVSLKAYSEGNYIIIEIQDDGRGMDPQKIFKKAVEKGLATPEEAQHLSDNEMLDFIFAPGFSTAESISNISGRGVGMNVVKENILKLDGLIEIDSRIGEGSTFKIQLPLTMAIVPALLVNVGESTYAIPLNNVVETLVISPAEIYTIDQKEVIHLRDRVVSLTHLAEVLGKPLPQRMPEKYYVIIVGAGEQRVGLVVDHLLGQEEVVIKSLGEFFADIHLIAGATIMGDGSVVLILDIGNILQQIGRRPVYQQKLAEA